MERKCEHHIGVQHLTSSLFTLPTSAMIPCLLCLSERGACTVILPPQRRSLASKCSLAL